MKNRWLSRVFLYDPCLSRSLFSWLRHSLLLVTFVVSICGGDIRNNEVTDYSLQRVRLKSDEPLSSFVLTSNSVFVGGTNVLYQLDSEDLVVKSLVKTGPQLDSAKCHATGKIFRIIYHKIWYTYLPALLL